MSYTARYLATAAVVASLVLAAPARAESEPEATCTDGTWYVLEEDELDDEPSQHLAAFREAAQAAQALTAVSRPIEVMAIDCTTYSQEVRVGERGLLSAPFGSRPSPPEELKYTLYVPLSLLEKDPLEQARTARRYVCSVGNQSVTGEPSRIAAAACELQAAVAAGDDEPWYREWLERKRPPSEAGPVAHK